MKNCLHYSLDVNFIHLDIPLTISLLKTEKELDSLFSKNRDWLKEEEKPSFKNPQYQSRAFRKYIKN